MAVFYWRGVKTTDLPLKEDQAAIAVLPLGAVEQHGPHLPLGTDAIIAEALAERCCRAAAHRNPSQSYYLLPTEMVGHSPEHLSFPGTLSEPAEALLARWTRIGAGISAAGIKRLLFLNAHGGQPQILDLVARDLRRTQNISVATVSWPDLGAPEGLFGHKELLYGLHGGQIETAMMLSLAPEIVSMEAASDFTNAEENHGRRLLSATGPGIKAWMAEDLNPAGVTGNAASATKAQGDAMLAHITGKLVDILEEMAAYPLPKPTKIPRGNA